MEIASYILGVTTGVVGSLVVVMLAGYANSKKEKSFIEQTIKHVSEHVDAAIDEGQKGNFGEAQKEMGQATKELTGMKQELALDEAIEPPNAETPSEQS